MKFPAFYVARIERARTERHVAAASSRWSSIQTAVAILGGIVASFVALSQWHDSNEQRRREFRYQQAKQGRELLEALFADSAAAPVREVMDRGRYVIPGPPRTEITRDDLTRILRDPSALPEKRGHMLASLDAFFYHLVLINHWIDTGLVTESDVFEPLSYYAMYMKIDHGDKKNLFVNYAEESGLRGVERFLIRHDRRVRELNAATR